MFLGEREKSEVKRGRKRPKGAERGIFIRISPLVPFRTLWSPLGPLTPLRPFQRSCRLVQAKQTQTLRAAQPNFLSEGVRCNARRISRRWAVLGRTAHWRDNSLAEVDDLLSQEISCQKGLGLASIKRLPQIGHTWRISYLGQ